MTELLLAIALGAGALPNFPVDTGGRISQAAIGIELGGSPVIVVAAGESVAAVRGDGGSVAGFPFALGPGEAASGAPAAADMDGDKRPEVAVVTTSGKLFLWSGKLLGAPISLGARAKAGASFADVDGDGKPEVLVGDERGRLHAFKKNGAEVRGYPIALGRAVTSTASSGSFAGGTSIAVGCEDGKVYVMDTAGHGRQGFPLATAFAVTGAPVFADVDDDGSNDLVVASQDFGVYVVDAKGRPLKGFPYKASYRIYEGAAIADLTGDARLEIAFASADGLLHVIDAAGKPLPGFPIRSAGRIFGGPVLGDLDRDGFVDVAVVSSDGYAAAYDRTGKKLAGFPAALGGADVGATPLLFDAVGDGTLSLFVGVPSGQLHAVRAPRSGTALAAAPWPGAARDAARTGRYGPNPPSYRDLALTPSEPRALDKVVASWRGVWLDATPGQSVPEPKIEWFRNGRPAKELDGKRELPPGTVRRGERWRFVLTPTVGTRVAESPEVRVLDTPPGEATVALDPPQPSRSGPIRAVVTKPPPDPDGDAITYRIDWLLEGLEAGVSGEKLPGELLRKGALVTARVVASDGELDARPVYVSARVGDTAPGAVAISIEPKSPRRADKLAVRLERAATDIDGDPISYRHRWTVAGEARNQPLEASLLPAGTARKHQKVKVEVRSFDGQLEGPPAEAEVTLRNTPPTKPQIELRPAKPRKGEAVRAVVVSASTDDDGDDVSYRFAWAKNGKPLAVAGDPRVVPGEEVSRNDRFEVTVTPNDGEEDGPAATAISVVTNTPPQPPRIALEPAHPKGGEAIRLVIQQPATDADGDAVRLQIAWTREGRQTGGGGEVLAPTDFRKHERVKVVVTPHDGQEAGEPVAAEVAVDNAVPGAPEVAFSTAKPAVTEPFKAVIKVAAKDADGDALKYRYRFLRDGTPVEVSDGTAESGRAPFWTARAEVPRALFAKGQHWEVEAEASDGEAWGPAAHARTLVVNAPPPAPQIGFSPSRPRKGDGLNLSVKQAADPDGDAITYRYTWFKNGQKLAAPPDQSQIARGGLKKGEQWAVEVVAMDGEAESPAVRAEAVVADTPPGALALGLCDGPVREGADLSATVLAPSVDVDGDSITLRSEWTVNGKAIPQSQGQLKLTGVKLRKHDLARVVVTPFDGELAGPSAAAECSVINTPPVAPQVAIEPQEPTAKSGLSVRVTRPASDRDADPVVYRYRWLRDGVPAGIEAASVVGGTPRHRERWRVEVTPFDGEEEGERAAAEAWVVNTPPATPVVAVTPAAPTVGQPLTCEVSTPERDADREPVTVIRRWKRDGKPMPLSDRAELPAGVVRHGEKWSCEAWSTDGYVDGGHAEASVTVLNTPPGPPAVAVEPAVPHAGDDLVCRIVTESADADGDAVTYTYTWQRNDKPFPAVPDPRVVAASLVKKGDRFRCTATPRDGRQDGTPGRAEKVVANSAPGPTRVTLEPWNPVEGKALRCVVTTKAEDPDGDAVKYRFTWQRNGQPQPFAESSVEVPVRLVRARDRWRCLVVPTDGDLDGPEAGSEEVQIGASPGGTSGADTVLP
ncbi:MAG TPA: FG-GAP-like repeat-containing protein [Anaeromyxobacteraceae bacterium]|nr:FG-GAP-like repeat-containing protein [Anaeromyxobacteraceae bacterium]